MQDADRQAAAAATRAHQAGNLAEAQAAYIRHLARFPQDAGIWTNLGALFRTVNRHDQALRAQANAYALQPRDAGIRNNYANILSDLGEYEASIELRREALSEDPSQLMQHAMIARCYRGLGQYRKAIDYLTPLEALFDDEHELPLQLAFAQLGAGDYGAAFRTYLCRWRSPEMKPRDLKLKQWRDGDEIAGKTILVLPEQGFGDAVLFSRFVSKLAQKGAKIHFLAEKPMARLFEGLEGAEWVGKDAADGGDYDYWMNLMDMPLAVFGPEEAGSPPEPTKLNIPQDSVERAKGIVAPYSDKFKIGVVWTGSATYKGNSFRSFTHREFLPMAGLEGVQLFSLYKGPYLDAFHADGSSAFIVDTASTDRDFADCAATMLEMDLVITSDTATAHIAGSLGVPVWTVLHWDPFWVFTHDGDTTDWYPNMRLFRQDGPQDWVSAFGKVEGALRQELMRKK